MAVLGFLFFAVVLLVSVATIVATVMPRRDYIVALLTGEYAALVPIPVAQRRRVSRISPLSLRSELRMIRAVA